MSNIVVIGYGNTIRGDDAVGVHAAHRLEEKFRDEPDVRVIATQQLTPELAEEVSEAKFVLFLDAALRNRPGEIVETLVVPHGAMGSMAHHVIPEALLMAAEQLYGEAPSALSLTIAGKCFEVGSRMSQEVSQRLDEFVGRASGIVVSWMAKRPQETAAHSR